MFKRS